MSYRSFIKLFLATFLFFFNIEIAFSADFTITKNSEERLDSMFPRTTKYAITKLKVIGEINTNDLLFIKEMATSGNLSHLDLSSSTIVDVDGIEDFFQNVKVGDKGNSQSFNRLKSVWAGSKSKSFIGYYIVYGDEIMTSFTYKEVIHIGVNSIPYHMFDGCVKLVSISLPSNTTLIGNYAFSNCKNLQFINFPGSLETIGEYAFSGCTKLSDVKLPTKLKKIGWYAFNSCKSIYSIAIPETVIALGPGVFSECKGLRIAKLPDSLQTIQASLFDGCDALYKVNIPLSCTEIPTYAFHGCSLDSIVIPKDVTNIGVGVFDGCKLSKVYCLAEIPPYSYEGISRSGGILYVPKGCSEVYSLSPGWKGFGRIIELPSDFQQSEELPDFTDTYITMSPNNGFDFNQGKDYVILYAPEEVIEKMGDKILSNQNLDLTNGDHSFQSAISNKPSIITVDRTNALNPYGGQDMLSLTPISGSNHLYFNSANSSYDLSTIDEEYIIHIDLCDFGGTEGKFRFQIGNRDVRKEQRYVDFEVNFGRDSIQYDPVYGVDNNNYHTTGVGYIGHDKYWYCVDIPIKELVNTINWGTAIKIPLWFSFGSQDWANYSNVEETTEGDETTYTITKLNDAVSIGSIFFYKKDKNYTNNISIPKALNNNRDNYYYTLQGIRVNKPGKGIYIHNGRKVIYH